MQKNPSYAIQHFPAISFTNDTQSQTKMSESIPNAGPKQTKTYTLYVRSLEGQIIFPIGCWVFNPQAALAKL